LRGNTLYITNETEGESFAVYESGKLRYLSGINSAEGIAATADGRILVVEDRKRQGRLLRIDPLTSAIEVLVDDLIEAEGVPEPSRSVHRTLISLR
jgi:sugar lactone lactonase YvrE